MNNIYVISLEPIETRYTCQWLDHIPNVLRFRTDTYNVINISGETKTNKTSNGAFLDFVNTNKWKNEQINKIMDLFNSNAIDDSDKFLFTDAWNSSIIQLRYVLDLLGKSCQIHAIWHAGSYDENDFLGRKVDKNWSYNFERSIYYACDFNYFATSYHFRLFHRILGCHSGNDYVTGLPFEFLENIYQPCEKENIVLFPHRLSDEKQPIYFDMLKEEFPDWKFIKCQETELTKDEYHKLLSKSKIIFSASLQETFGIGCVEGILTNNLVFVPDNLSYSEMYMNEFKYNSSLIRENWKFQDLVTEFRIFLDNYDKNYELLDEQKKRLKDFYTPELMYNLILS